MMRRHARREWRAAAPLYAALRKDSSAVSARARAVQRAAIMQRVRAFMRLRHSVAAMLAARSERAAAAAHAMILLLLPLFSPDAASRRFIAASAPIDAEMPAYMRARVYAYDVAEMKR